MGTFYLFCLGDGTKKEGRTMLPSCHGESRCWFFFIIHQQFVNTNAQSISQLVDNIRSGDIVLVLNSHDGRTGHMRRLRQPSYIKRTTCSPVLQSQSQRFQFSHKLFPFSSLYLQHNDNPFRKQNQHNSKTIVKEV